MICEQCEAFDSETRSLVAKFLSKDEVIMIFGLVSEFHLAQRKRMIPGDKITQLKNTKEIRMYLDFSAQLMGKLLVALEQKDREAVIANLEKRGHTFNVQHQPCPHGAA
jgi:hypothetical protein